MSSSSTLTNITSSAIKKMISGYWNITAFMIISWDVSRFPSLAALCRHVWEDPKVNDILSVPLTEDSPGVIPL